MAVKGKTTAQRGYDAAHQRTRQRLLRQHVDGTPCARCHQPMYKTQALDAGHTIALADGGTKADRLEHASCNRQAGALERTPARDKSRAERAEWTTRDWGMVALPGRGYP